MVQPGGDEQPLQKAVQENAQLPGRRDPPRDGVDALLQRGPDEADRQPEGRSKGRDAQKCPSQPGIHLRDQPFELLFTTVVEDVRRRKAQQDAARHAGVHHLNAEDGGLARGGKAGQAVGLGKAAQRVQRGVVGREEDEISHEGEQRGLLLFGAGAQGGDAHAQNGAEVVDEDHHPVVQHLAHQPDGGPVQRRAELAQRAAGEQRTHHQQQPRRRQIGQRRQKRLRKTLQLLQEFLHLFVPLSGTAHRRIHFIL